MATQDRRAKFGYATTDQVDVLPSDAPDALTAAGAPPVSSDDEPGEEPDSIHDAALILSEVMKSAIEMAGQLEKDGADAGVDDTTKRAMAQVSELLGQASVAMETVETSLGIEREDSEASAPSTPPAGAPPIDAVRRVLAKRRPPAG